MEILTDFNNDLCDTVVAGVEDLLAGFTSTSLRICGTSKSWNTTKCRDVGEGTSTSCGQFGEGLRGTLNDVEAVADLGSRNGRDDRNECCSSEENGFEREHFCVYDETNVGVFEKE